MPEQLYQAYRQLVEPHVASFNYFATEGLQSVVKHVRPVEVRSGEKGDLEFGVA